MELGVKEGLDWGQLIPGPETAMVGGTGARVGWTLGLKVPGSLQRCWRGGVERNPLLAQPSSPGPCRRVGTQPTSPSGPKSRAKQAPGNHHQSASSLHVVLRLVAVKRSAASETQ